MIVHQTWRSMFYKLSEHYPDCLMLNFTIKVNFESYFSTRMNVMTDLGFVMPCRTSVIIFAVFDTRYVGRENEKGHLRTTELFSLSSSLKHMPTTND